MKALSLVVCAFALATISSSSAQVPSHDWPQWRGPDRTGLSRETGLLAQWPAGPPPLVWSVSNLGTGYGSIAVAADRIFVQGSNGQQSAVTALNRADGKGAWIKYLGPAGVNDRGSGPRGTPTVDGNRVYVLTEAGDLACLRVADGSVVWQRNILREFHGRMPQWLISESPLVDGNRVFVTPGGPGASVVALDKMTGQTIWTTKDLSDEAAYSSIVAADVHGVRTLMTLTAGAGVGIRASDGAVMWRYPKPANSTANVATPVVADNKVFYSSAYNTGGGLLDLAAEGGALREREVYFTRDMQNHHGGMLLVNGYLYGFNNSILTCLEFASGKVMWRDRSVGKGSLTYADGRLYVLSEDNVVGLVEATPAAYHELGRFKIADSGWPSWAHPVVSGGRLYIRNQGTLAAYDVRAR